MDEPKLIGILSALLAKGKKAFSGYVQANRKLQRNLKLFYFHKASFLGFIQSKLNPIFVTLYIAETKTFTLKPKTT